MLDEVHFLMHTDIEADKRWLRRLVKNQGLEEHFKLKAEDTDGNWSLWKSFSNLYKNFMTDPDTIYIKIDDDIVGITHAVLRLRLTYCSYSWTTWPSPSSCSRLLSIPRPTQS